MWPVRLRRHMGTQSWEILLKQLQPRSVFAEELIKQGLIVETASGGAICNICGYASDIYNDVRRHLEGKHSIGHGYPCPLCGFKSKTESTRRRHVLNMHKKTFSTTELRLMSEKGVP